MQARDVGTAVEMVAEMIEKAGGGHDADTLWLMAISELDRDRAEIEDDVLAHHGFVVPEHEWAAFIEWVGLAGRLTPGLAGSNAQTGGTLPRFGAPSL